jgi:hypothetical protein
MCNLDSLIPKDTSYNLLGRIVISPSMDLAIETEQRTCAPGVEEKCRSSLDDWAPSFSVSLLNEW